MRRLGPAGRTRARGRDAGLAALVRVSGLLRFSFEPDALEEHLGDPFVMTCVQTRKRSARLVAVLAAALVFPWAVTSCRSAARPGAEAALARSPSFTALSGSLEPVRDWFEERRTRPRALLLLSPT